jgi:hypothetical protein
MLRVEQGWTIPSSGLNLQVDDQEPGRFSPGSLLIDELEVPRPNLGWQEVVYATPADRQRSGSITVGSPDGRSATTVNWDTSFFKHLWIVTLSGFFGVDLALVLEPSTTKPFRLEEAIPLGEAVHFDHPCTRSFWSEVLSNDRPSEDLDHAARFGVDAAT